MATSCPEGGRSLWAFEQLSDAGSRRTTARKLVLDALDEDGGHQPVAEIHARVLARSPAVTLSTVYRTLATLAELRLVHALSRGGESHYGFADEAHHHAICARCGHVADIPAGALADVIPHLQAAAGLVLDDDGITLTGLCARCMAR